MSYVLLTILKTNHVHTEVAYLICRELIIICKTIPQEQNIPIEKQVKTRQFTKQMQVDNMEENDC